MINKSVNYEPKISELQGDFMNEKTVRIGLVGFGTVGAGVAKLIIEDANSIAAKTGIRLVLACVVDIDTESPRPVQLPHGLLTNDINKLLKDNTIDVGRRRKSGKKTNDNILINCPMASTWWNISCMGPLFIRICCTISWRGRSHSELGRN